MSRIILIVEQSATIRKILKGMIEANLNDAVVVEAESRDDADHMMLKNKINLVLFAWETGSGKADWNDFISRNKTLPNNKGLQFIVMAGSNQQDIILQAMEAGADDKVFIPCSVDILIDRINCRCHPIALRHSKRYAIPATTAIIAQDTHSFPAYVVNISAGGLLCDLPYTKEFRYDMPTIITVHFYCQGVKFEAVGLHAVLRRLQVKESTETQEPATIRVSYLFTEVPNSSRKTLDQVFRYAESQESSFFPD